jgi:two-component system sensor histidine kinase BaeS
VYAPDGRLLFGAPLGAAPRAVIAQPVRVAGAVVASVRMPASARVPDAVERAFLQRQYLGIAVVAVGLLVLGVIAARWIAGRWVNPLLSIQAATARIARGEFSVRLGEERSDEIGDLVRDLNRMAAGLQRLEVSRRRWIAEISHELRTPLTVLRGELDALEDGVRPFGAAALASLREEALRLSAIVDDLHLLAMADLEALPVHPVADDATRIVARVRERFALRAADRGLALELEAPPEGSLNVRWDGPRIEQLLGNLLENSLRYTDAPGTIRLTVAPNADTIDLDVDDSPPGVPSAALERLFEPLYRLDAARSRERGGSGLGLAICRALARAHGGEIQALASPLGGLRVRVRLPLPTVATHAEPRPA